MDALLLCLCLLGGATRRKGLYRGFFGQSAPLRLPRAPAQLAQLVPRGFPAGPSVNPTDATAGCLKKCKDSDTYKMTLKMKEKEPRVENLAKVEVIKM
jgi:hypothetical protein